MLKKYGITKSREKFFFFRIWHLLLPSTGILTTGDVQINPLSQDSCRDILNKITLLPRMKLSRPNLRPMELDDKISAAKCIEVTLM